MLQIINSNQPETIYPCNYLENHFQGTDSKNIEKFMQIFEDYASTLNDSEREIILKNQIDNIEQSLLENDLSESRRTLLSVIIEKSPEFAIKYMSIFRSSINLRSRGHLPLIDACKAQNVGLVQELIKNGANPDARDIFDHNALGDCIESADFVYPSKESEQIFDILLEAGCDVNIPTDLFSSSPLISCLTKRIDQWAWKLLPRSDINYKNTLGMLALHQAVRYSFCRDLILEVIKKTADINALAVPGCLSTRRVTPCHMAVASNKPEVLGLLIDAGADPHVKAINPWYGKGDDQEPYSAYMMAVDLGIKECVKVILDKCPPKKQDLDPGFKRDPHSIFSGKKQNLKLLAEGEASKSQLNLVKINGVSFFVDVKEEENLKQMIKQYFTESVKGEFSLYLPIWEAICKHAASNEGFSVIFSPDETNSSCGKFNTETRNEIFIYLKEFNVEMGEYMLHEMAHKCAEVIYGKNCAPSDRSHRLYNAIKLDLEKLPTVINKHAWRIDFIFSALESYPETQHPQECIARIPQAIYTLIHEGGLSPVEADLVMRKCLPNLYEFYINDFLPECKKLLATA